MGTYADTHIHTRTPSNPVPSAVELLEGARRLLNSGDHTGAHRLSLEATRLDPKNVEAWLVRSRAAASREENLFCLSQVSRINPDYPPSRLDLYRALWSQLQHDAFLAYIDETDQVYYVRSNEYLSLAVPKDRSIPEVYPPERPAPLARANRWLAWAIIGLALAGLGTLVFAPLAFLSAVTALTGPLERPDRIRAGIVLFLAAVLAACAILLGWLFLIHLRG